MAARSGAAPISLEDTALFMMRETLLDVPLREHRFHPTRKWRFDFAWPQYLIGLEVEGGTRSGGRHTRHDGFEDDCEKYDEAAILGWRVLRYTGSQINAGLHLRHLRRILPAKASKPLPPARARLWGLTP